MIESKIREALESALNTLRTDGLIPTDSNGPIELERPARAEHGDLSTNLALGLAKSVDMKPRELAELIVKYLPPLSSVSAVEIAGPGFINFRLSLSWLHEVVNRIATEGERYGRSELGAGERVQVEFGSANPTGPLHVGNARGIVYGDALARVLEAAGYEVQRENYLNDAGGQLDRFARSLEARYRQALGLDAEVPEDGYLGDYLVDFGRELADAEGMGLIGKPQEIADWGVTRVLQWQKQTLERFGVTYDNWKREGSLHESGEIEGAIQKLRDGGHVFEDEGAVWFRATEFGNPKDKVLIRSEERGGMPTYLAADCAYLLDKLSRGFDHLIYVWGTDHHGTAANLMAAAKAFGVEAKVEIILHQFVNFMKGGEPAPMAKRTGDLVTLDELLDEVGVDAARFTFLTRGPDASLDFDFDIVKSQSLKNPVYYVQYAHARISAILRYAAEQGIEKVPIGSAPLSELVHESEHQLIRKLAEFPEVVQISANLRAPYRLTTYARQLAESWHIFYEKCRVIGDELALTQARLWLAEATRRVLANNLATLGVSAPDRM